MNNLFDFLRLRLQPDSFQNIQKKLNDLMDESYEDGHRDGYDDGYENGLQEGYDEGLIC